MKITFYELLGLVKDGKAPKKIKFGNIELEYDEKCEDYYSYYGQGLFEYKFGNCKNFLNDVVEIIEETKKIEKWGEGSLEEMEKCTNYTLEDLQKYIRILAETQNELIDEINNLKEND